MPSWYRLPFVLVLLSALVLLVVIPATVSPATASIQLSGISSGSVDLGDDLDDTCDMMLVAGETTAAPQPSRPLPLSPWLAGPGPETSLDRPPDRSPPAGPARPLISAPAAHAPPFHLPIGVASLEPASLLNPAPRLPAVTTAPVSSTFVRTGIGVDVSLLHSLSFHPVLLLDQSPSYLPPLTAHRENLTWPL